MGCIQGRYKKQSFFSKKNFQIVHQQLQDSLVLYFTHWVKEGVLLTAQLFV